MAKFTINPAEVELKQLKELCAEKGVDAAIVARIDKALTLIRAREEYCADITSQPSKALRKIINETFKHDFEKAFKDGKAKWNMPPYMITGPLNGGFLQSFTSAAKAKRVLEIGTFTGYGALAFAEVLPSDGEVVTLEFDPYLEPMARDLWNNSPHGKKIQIRQADDTLKDLAKEGKPFDMVFVDANKDGYIGYYKALMANNLLAKGGTMLFDNTLASGAGYLKGEDLASVSDNAKHIKDFNTFLQSKDDIFRVLVPIGDGVLIVRRKEDTIV